MKKFNNKSGFTLIEIIVVLIIVGILAAIALPNLFGNIQKSRAAEGLGVLDGYKDSVEGCVQGHQATAATDCTFAKLGLTSASGTFTYAYTTAPVNNSLLFGLQGAYVPNSPTDTITLTASTTGNFTCVGEGNFTSAC